VLSRPRAIPLGPLIPLIPPASALAIVALLGIVSRDVLFLRLHAVSLLRAFLPAQFATTVAVLS
jgi:hypothetical protein